MSDATFGESLSNVALVHLSHGLHPVLDVLLMKLLVICGSYSTFKVQFSLGSVLDLEGQSCELLHYVWPKL